MIIEKIKQKLSTKKIDAYQIDYSKSSQTSIVVFEQKVDKSSIKEIETINIKVKIGKKIGSYQTERITEDNINNIINTAIENAKLIELEEENFFHDGSGDYKKVSPYKPNMKKLKNIDIIKFLKDLEKAAYKQDKRINKVISTTYNHSKNLYIKENSLGLSLSQSLESAYSNIYLSAKTNNDIKTGYANTTFVNDKDFDITQIAKKAVDRAVDRLGGVNVSSKKYNVVFENIAFAKLLPSLIPPFTATSIEEKYSKLEGRIEQKIASKIVTLIDNPHLKGGFSTTSYDAQGIPTQNKKIIEKGVLKTFLYNLRTANKQGIKSTGNAGGEDSIRVYNTYLKPSKSSKQEVLSKAKEGIYVTSVSGLNAGYNKITGDISFVAEGFIIKNGKIDKPLNQFVINTNLYDLLLNIEMIANDLEFEGSQYGSPTILIKDISVSSK